MNTNNIYRSPEAELLGTQGGDIELASLSQRLGGALIDGGIGIAAAIAMMMVIGTWEKTLQGIGPTLFETLFQGAFGFGFFVLVHGHLLKTSGQTVGKRIVGSKIVLIDDTPAPFFTIIFRRSLPVALASIIPYIGGLLVIIDSLLVFRADRRCAHDLIAGTKVIRTK